MASDQDTLAKTTAACMDATYLKKPWVSWSCKGPRKHVRLVEDKPHLARAVGTCLRRIFASSALGTTEGV